MASNLEKQLNYLRSIFPQATSAKPLKQGKEKESFLFDVKKAAELSTNHIYSLASDGLDELCSIDGRFTPFKESLFHAKSVNFNREMQLDDVNQQIDKSIDTFLRLLSPYFLLKAAHKALEYLIRRYKIHVYNVDQIMECIIAYHDTLLFSRLVQILNLESNEMWSFLQPIKFSGAALPRETLVLRCKTDFSVLEFIANAVKKTVEEAIDHKSLISVYSVSSIELVEQHTLTNVQLKRLLPFLLFGLKSDNRELRIATYMILTQMSSKLQFTAKMWNVIVNHLLNGVTHFDNEEAFVCLMYLFQSQKVEEISVDVFQTILKTKNLVARIQSIATQYEVTRFLSVFGTNLIDYCLAEKQTKLLETMLIELPIRNLIPQFTQHIFELYFKFPQHKSAIQSILVLFEQRYATELDKGLYLCIQNLEDEDSEEVLEFVKLSFRGTKHELNESLQSTLYLSLEHPEASVRALALQQLANLTQQEEVSEEVKKFATESLLQKMSDNDFVVLHSVLNFPNLVRIVQPDALAKKLILILGFAAKQSNKPAAVTKLVKHCLEVLLSFTVEDKEIMFSILAAVLNALYILAGFGKETYQDAMKSIAPKLISLVDNSKVTSMNLLLHHIAQQYSRQELQQLETLLHEPIFMVILLLSTKYQKNEQLSYAFALVKQIMSFKESTVIATAMQVILDQEFSSLQVYLLQEVIQNISLQKDYSISFAVIAEAMDQQLCSQPIHLWLHVLVCAITMSKQQDTTSIILHILKHIQGAIQLLLELVLIDTVSLSLKQTILSMVQTIIASQSSSIGLQQLIPYFMFCLRHSQQVLRVAALNCIENLSFVSKQKIYKINLSTPLEEKMIPSIESFQTLCQTIEKNKTKISSDSAYFGILFGKKSSKEWDQFLIHFVLHHESMALKYALLEILSNSHHVQKLLVLLPLLQQFLNKAHAKQIFYLDEQIFFCAMLRQLFTPSVVELINNNKQVLQILQSALQSYQPVSYLNQFKETEQFIPCLEVLPCITQEFFGKLSAKNQEVIFDTLCTIIRNCPSQSTTMLVKEMCKTFKMNAATIVKHLPIDFASSESIEKLISFLELLLLMDQLDGKLELIAKCFEILEQLIQQVGDSRFVFATTMVLSLVTDLIQSVGNGAKEDQLAGVIKLDLLFDCLRQSNANQIRTQTISLIGHLATIIPETILANMVTLLSILEQSFQNLDVVSLEAIESSLLSILPKLVEREMSPISIINVFVNGFESIPQDRRIPIFSSIVKQVTRKKLYLVVYLLLKKGEQEVANFAQELVLYFQTPKQLTCVFHLALFVLKQVYQQKESGEEEGNVVDIPWEEESVADEDRNDTCQTIISFIQSLLTSSVFLQEFYSSAAEDFNQDTALALAESVLLLTSYLRSNKKPKTLHQLCFETADKASQLLDASHFVKLIKVLLVNATDSHVRAIGLEVLNNKLADPLESTKAFIINGKTNFLSLTKPLKKMLANQEESYIAIHNALISGQLIGYHFGEDNSEVVSQLIPCMIPHLRAENKVIVSSAALALGSLCEVCKEASIGYLPKVCKLLCKAMRDTLSSEEDEEESKQQQNTDLKLALLFALHQIATHFHNYISPYVEDLIYILLHQDIVNASSTNIKKKATEMLEYVSSTVEPRLLLPPVLSAYSSALLFGQSSIITLLQFLKNILNSFPAQFIESFREQLAQFFMKVFDNRRLQIETITNITTVEEATLQAFKAFLLKLNTGVFQTIFLSLIDWARVPKKQLDKGSDEEPDENRLLVFYKVTLLSVNTLKQIFVPFFGLFIESAIHDLTRLKVPVSDNNNLSGVKRKRREESDDEEEDDEEDSDEEDAEISSENMEHVILYYLLSTIGKICEHDAKRQFLNNNRSLFDKLYPVMVDQLENLGMTEWKETKQRLRVLSESLGQLASCTPTSFWKSLQFAVLNKLQSKNARLRWAALCVLEQFYLKAGQEFIVVLPEMIPYVAELLDDDDDNVVAQVQQLIASVEEVTGENIREHLQK